MRRQTALILGGSVSITLLVVAVCGVALGFRGSALHRSSLSATLPPPPPLTTTPTATPVVPAPPPVLQTGVLCSYPAEYFEWTNPECTFAFNHTFCQSIRNQTNGTCIRENCATLISFGSGPWKFPFGTLFNEPGNQAEGALQVSNLTGPVYLIQLIARFVFQNRVTSLDTPLPQPLDTEVLLTDLDYVAQKSFQIPSRELARQAIVFYFNFLLNLNTNFKPEPLQSAIDFAVQNAVVVPSRCVTRPELRSIPWLAYNNVTYDALHWILLTLGAVNRTAAIFDSLHAFQTWCLNDLYPFYCDLVPSYYPLANFVNVSLSPSPYLHALYIMRAMNEEFLNCGTPVGCMGLDVPS